MLRPQSNYLVAAVALAAVFAGAWMYWKMITKPSPPPASVEAVMPRELTMELAKVRGENSSAAKIAKEKKPAPDWKRSSVVFTGNARDKLRVVAKNGGDTELTVELNMGDAFDSERGRVVLLQSCKIAVPPNKTAEENLRVAAASVKNKMGEAEFAKSSVTLPKLAPLLAYFQQHPTAPTMPVQIAVLAVAENAPLDAFAKFKRALPRPEFAQSEFKSDTGDILTALQLLREAGIASCALAEDPQLKIEAMFDPQSHEQAMQFYKIEPDNEWDFWKHELLEGEPGTRHFALYGIARYFPDVALQMMPRWARETRTLPLYRCAAIGALALTNKPEAAPILRKIQEESAPDTEAHRYALLSLQYLETQIPHLVK